MINYYLLTKPGIVMGNLITVAAGFLLASKGAMNWQLFLATLLGLTLIMASACVFNNYIDREIDRKMKRTKSRAFVLEKVAVGQALLFASLLGIGGNLVLIFYTNILTVCVADIGFFIYVILYSLWKSRTVYGTAIGSLAGAVPPVVGYCAVRNEFDAGALILFAMLVLWQMPHFFSIALFHFDDYVAAKIPVLPVEKGVLRTKIHMLLYIMSFIAVSTLLTLLGFTGYVYLFVALTTGSLWLFTCMKGFKQNDDQAWARQMFFLSLFMLNSLCLVIPFDIQPFA